MKNNKELKILFLDDSEERYKSFKKNNLNYFINWVTTSKEAIEKLKSQDWDFVFLDHDLDYYNRGINGTGSEVSLWIRHNSYKFKNTYFILHTLNHVGAECMYLDLTYKKLNVKIEAWVWDKANFLNNFQYE